MNKEAALILWDELLRVHIELGTMRAESPEVFMERFRQFVERTGPAFTGSISEAELLDRVLMTLDSINAGAPDDVAGPN